MAEALSENLALRINGETWVSYPASMCFPKAFCRCYPFRGRRLVSRLLYYMHCLRLDRCCLRHVTAPRGLEGLALFWPSKRRSTERYYGYRVNNGEISAYLKIATTQGERMRLRQEIENVRRIQSLAGLPFRVPKCVDVHDSTVGLIASFEPLPKNAIPLPVEDRFLSRVLSAGEEISSAGCTHGDFVWHNFKYNPDSDELWILDWEEMRNAVHPYVDAISAEMGYWFYQCKMSLDKVLDIFRGKYEGTADQKALAIQAVEDLARRNITMGAVLQNALRGQGK